MGSGDQLKVVGVIELLGDVLTERVSRTSWGDTPSTSVIWVGPQKIANRTLVWHLHDSIELLNLIESVDTWGEPTMKAEDISLNHSSKWQIIEETGEVLPNIGISVFPKALIIESINLCDLLALVISSKDGDSAGVSDFQRHQEGHSLDRVVSSVNIVTHEKVVVIWELTTNLEEFFQIIELSMDITANCDWRPHRLDIALINQDFLGFLAKSLDVVLRQWLALEELVDLGVQILDVTEVHFASGSHIYSKFKK